MKTSLLIISVFIILVSVLAYSQQKIEENRVQKKDIIYFLPKKEHLSYTTFGFKPVVADLLWFRGVSYFLYNLNNNNDYPYLFGIFEASLTLDPHFKQIYRDTLTLLISDKEHYKEAEKLMLYGLNAMPNDWEINYLAGMLYQFYLKNSEKSLPYFEKAWGQIPRDKQHERTLDNINILIKAITEKTNDKNSLVLYWIDKFHNSYGKESVDYAGQQIIKYSSLYMEDILNNILNMPLSEEEKQNKLNNEISKWNLFFQKHNLERIIKLPNDKIFSVCDTYGYPWVYSESQKKIYSFGYASEYLKRKINLYNIMLWEKAQDYLTLSALELSQLSISEREKNVKLKPKYKEFPSLQSLIPDLRSYLKCEVPLLPVFNQEEFKFSVPAFEDLKKIDPQFR